MKQIRLTPRLDAVAGYVAPGAAVADIGTDHGYVPVWLAQNDLARRIVAADIGRGPLERARASARLYGVADQIEFIQTDGLDGLASAGLDTVILAGMGGQTMLGILARAGWAHATGVRCILQPQSKCEELIAWLGENGYAIRDASLVRDGGRLYIVLLAQAGASDETPLTILLKKRDELLPEYIDRLAAEKRRAVEGLKKAAGRAEELGREESAYEALLRIKEETDKWPR